MITRMHARLITKHRLNCRDNVTASGAHRARYAAGLKSSKTDTLIGRRSKFPPKHNKVSKIIRKHDVCTFVVHHRFQVPAHRRGRTLRRTTPPFETSTIDTYSSPRACVFLWIVCGVSEYTVLSQPCDFRPLSVLLRTRRLCLAVNCDPIFGFFRGQHGFPALALCLCRSCRAYRREIRLNFCRADGVRFRRHLNADNRILQPTRTIIAPAV